MRGLMLGAMLLAVGGCAIPGWPLEGREAQSASYVLEAAPVGVGALRGHDRTLVVSAPQAQPGYAGREIAYARDPLALSYYARNHWADAPARMLGGQLLKALSDSGVVRAVIPAPAAVTADLRLDVELVRLRQEFYASPSQTRLTLRVSLYDLATRRVLGSRELEAVEPAASEDARGGVVAAQRALGRLLGETIRFVDDLLRQGG